MLIISLIALPSLFILNILFGMRHKFGYRHYWFFESLHFLGGFFVAMFFASFTHSFTIILYGLLAVTLIWELLEYLLTKIPKLFWFITRTFHKKPTYELKDTILDIALNLIGGLVFYFLIIRYGW